MSLESTPPASRASSQPHPPSLVAAGAPTTPATPADIANLVASTSGLKRQRAGTHVVSQAGDAATGVVPAVPGRAKGAATAKPTMAPKTSHVKEDEVEDRDEPWRPGPAPSPVAFDRNGNASFMEILDVVDIVVPPLAPLDVGVDEDGEEDDGEDDEGEEWDEGDEDKGEEEGVVEVEANGKKKKKRRANNYTEIEDKRFCRAWVAVGMDAFSSTGQTGKRYRDMAGSKGKSFTMRYCFDVLQYRPKWQLRDEETALKKDAMVRLDDTKDEKEGRNNDNPEGNKKDKEMLKLEGEAPLLRDKIDQMIKSKEVEAIREEARNKAKLEEMKISVKKTKAMKQGRREGDHMMSTKDMNEQQIKWWKEATAEIMERLRIAREGASGGASTTHGGGDDEGGDGPISI
ncbi:hypothetical protein QYE76_051104 [Lolium multiflorum]|uniref:No apical meristem-associated C-terminal domain-containing protein n=1 Tax=Lolium multiflorum TaxID=4521 RepID=A0AAD8SS73_LOLMU|nr:hypothetical protein QYE76_051104 [Lolium multiflorum]